MKQNSSILVTSTLPHDRWPALKIALMLWAGVLWTNVGADLPVHCLAGDVAGDWAFNLGPASDDRPACGHSHPDDAQQEPFAGPQTFYYAGSEQINVELFEGGSARCTGKCSGDGSWQMISDEAVEVNIGDQQFLAFLSFNPLPVDVAGEHLPLALQKRHSKCGETVLGWYRDSNRTRWGCWYGKKADRSTFLQQQGRSNQQHQKFARKSEANLVSREQTPSLDWRNRSGISWVDKPLHQGRCGGCFAIAVAQMLSARHRISSGDPNAQGFSAALPIFCGEYTEGCQGGYPFLAAKWSEDVGLLPEHCAPLSSSDTEDGSCAAVAASALSCLAENQQGRFRAANHHYSVGGEEALLEELESNGPVAVSFKSDPSLMKYTGGIWIPAAEEDDGSSDQDADFIAPTHSALLIGHGRSEEGPYWLLQNAWGEAFGEHGVFRMLRKDARARGLESYAVVADVVPDDNPGILEGLLNHASSEDNRASPQAALLQSAASSTRSIQKHQSDRALRKSDLVVRKSKSRVRRHRGAILCTEPATGPGESSISVRVDVDQNFRGLSFGSSAGTETAVQCAGPMPETCKPVEDGADPPSCASIDSCSCDLHNAELPFPGMQALGEKVALLCTSSTDAVHVLLIGLGGGAVSSYLSDRCPPERFTLESVEKDGRVANLAAKFFGFQKGERNSVEVTDGFSAVRERAPGSYDAVVVDCFAGDNVPQDCRSSEFLQSVKAILKEDGLLLQNIWGRSSANAEVGPEFNQTVSAYTEVFGAPPRREVVTDVEQSLEYVLYGVKGSKWVDLLPEEML